MGEVLLGTSDVERESAFSRHPEVADRLLFEPRSLGKTRSVGQLECLQGVVCEDIGQGFKPLTRLALDPCRSRWMPGCAVGPRHAGVTDVSNEDMPEAVLRLALHRRRARMPHELLTRKLVERELDVAQFPLAHLCDRACPKHLAEDGGVLEKSLPLQRQRVETSRDQGLDRLRQVRGFPELSLLCKQTHELLGIERIPTCPLDQRLLCLHRQE